MSVSTFKQSVNRPVVGAVWGLTLLALIPFPNLAFVLLGAAANLAANGMALFLLCSRSRADRVHGVARLAVQVVTVALVAVAIVRSGVSMEGFFHYVTNRTL